MKRFSELNNQPEISALEYGMDFRLPEYRREVFLRFYEFHLKYKAHAGAVYYVFPALFQKFNFTPEQKLWFCFINGCSQHVLTTWEIFSAFPDFDFQKDFERLCGFFKANYSRFGWDTDRRYHKTKFLECVKNYWEICDRFGGQLELFSTLTRTGDPFVNFNAAWAFTMKNFVYFGRLACFSYLEYLRISGLNLDCGNLFFDDLSGSKSHRNGLCKVLGRDDYDWHSSNPNFSGEYTAADFADFDREAAALLTEARRRFNHPDIGLFTLETTLCCYKSWHRPNRRYPNVYNDMFAARILKHQTHWNGNGEIFWQIRRESLPRYLRIEDSPADLGLTPPKQNQYLYTGQVIMMDRDWSCFKNDYNDWVNAHNPPPVKVSGAGA